MTYNTGLWGESREGIGAFWFDNNISFNILSATVNKTLDFVGNNFTFSAISSANGLGSDWTVSYYFSFTDHSRVVTSSTSAQHSFGYKGNYLWGVYANVTNSQGDILITSVATGKPVYVNPLPEIWINGSPSVSSVIIFSDEHGSLYFDGTITNIVWDFGDGNTSSTVDTTATFEHTYSTKGNYTVSVSAFDISGNIGISTTSISIIESSCCQTKEDYITICGPDIVGRYGSCKNINLREYLPLYLRGGETEEFLILFEEFLNNMYNGLCGWEISSTELTTRSSFYVSNSGTSSATAQQDFIYSATDVSARTDATNVEQMQLIEPSNINYFTSAQKISILEKVARLTELHDPSLIDIEYIQFFASNLGYNVSVSRDEVGVSAEGIQSGEFGTTEIDSNCSASDINKYLRFVVENLPSWYKIKTTRNSIKVMLYSFGLVGEIIEYFSSDYSEDSKNWRADFNKDLSEIPNNWFPTPHFAVYIDFDKSQDISQQNRRNSVVNAIESIRPINTVFRKLAGYVKRVFELEVACWVRSSVYIKIDSNGYSNDWNGYIYPE